MIADCHVHSAYSFDGHDSPELLCRTAAERGVTSLVITDHYDIDGILDGFYPDYDAKSARAEIEAARDAYDGRVKLWRGIELGQGGLRRAEAEAFLEKNRFDFVIASCHNLKDVPDFFFFDFTLMTDALIASLYRRMLEETCLHAVLPGVHTVAHLTYPLRYIAQSGRTLSLSPFYDHFRTLFEKMRQNGVAMELNTKGLWKNMISAETELSVLRLWQESGGEFVTIGSDAHRATEIGYGIDDGLALLREAGFDAILLPTPDGVRPVKF